MADESAAPAPPAETEPLPPQPAIDVSVVGRVGMMTSRGSNDGLLVAPSAGVGAETFLTTHFGVSVRYDFATALDGARALEVRRTSQHAVLLAEGRLRLLDVATLHAAAGGGGALDIVTLTLPGDSRTTSKIEPGLAWSGSFAIEIPRSRLTTFIGATGMLHAVSHDILYFTGIAYRL